MRELPGRCPHTLEAARARRAQRFPIVERIVPALTPRGDVMSTGMMFTPTGHAAIVVTLFDRHGPERIRQACVRMNHVGSSVAGGLSGRKRFLTPGNDWGVQRTIFRGGQLRKSPRQGARRACNGAA